MGALGLLTEPLVAKAGASVADVGAGPNLATEVSSIVVENPRPVLSPALPLQSPEAAASDEKEAGAARNCAEMLGLG